MEVKSPVLAGKQLNVLRGVALTVSETPKLRLLTDLPNASGVGPEVTTSGTAYAPVDVTSGDMNAAVDGRISNSAILDYPIATASYKPMAWQVTVGSDIFYAGHLRQGYTIEVGNYFFFDVVDKNFVIDESNSLLPQCTSIALRNKRLDAVFKGTALTPQANVTIRLTKTRPDPVTGAATLFSTSVEKTYPCNTGAWDDPLLTRETHNLNQIVFDQFTEDMGEIGGYQLVSDGELWMWGILTPGKYGWKRDKLTLDVGAVIVRA